MIPTKRHTKRFTFRQTVRTLVTSLIDIIGELVKAFKSNITEDGGEIRSKGILTKLLAYYREQGLYDYIKVLWSAETGIKIANPDDTLKRLSKGYSLDATPNDWTQSVEANQPYLGGDVAPGDKYYAKGATGEERYGDFTEVAFAANDPWTITVVMNWDGSEEDYTAIVGKASDTASLITLRSGGENKFSFTNEGGTSVAGVKTINHLVGKTVIVSFVATGTGSLKVYVDGELFETLTVATNVKLSTFLRGFSTVERNFWGRLYYIDIVASDMSSSISSLHSMLNKCKGVITVEIGTQEWAISDYNGVVTPMGNIIPEVRGAVAWGALTTPGWCYYNLDTPTGMVYGRMYNWHAVMQLQDDITAWNTANPDNLYEYHVPEISEFQTLITTLGGAGVAGSKLMKEGDAYWETCIGNNSSGFTALGSGTRSKSGAFSALLIAVRYWTTTLLTSTSGKALEIFSSGSVNADKNLNVKTGATIRLIKD